MRNIFFALIALLFVLAGPAQALELRILTRLESPPTVPPRGYFWTDGYCWDDRDGAGQCQYH